MKKIISSFLLITGISLLNMSLSCEASDEPSGELAELTLIQEEKSSLSTESTEKPLQNPWTVLTQRYLSYIVPEINLKEEIQDPKVAFAMLIKTLADLGNLRVPHSHIKQGPHYGFSFIAKNAPPVDYIVELLTAKKNWKQPVIEKTSLAVADLGCGLGLSALSLISQVIQTYEREDWKLRQPIQFDLFDVSIEHQPALQALAAIVNAAYPQYFQVTSYQYDLTQSFEGKGFAENTYQIIFLLNVMHYISAPQWKDALEHTKALMKKNGLLFLTTDHYLSGTDGRNQRFFYEDALKSLESPFFFPQLTLFSPEKGVYRGTRIYNLGAFSFLKEGQASIPGKVYEYSEADEHLL